MRVATSCAGRFQFSVEKAKSVSWSRPIAAPWRVTARTLSTPCLWPRMRARPRLWAQRPLPSMMIATCRAPPGFFEASDAILGTTPRGGANRTTLIRDGAASRAEVRRSPESRVPRGFGPCRGVGLGPLRDALLGPDEAVALGSHADH